MVLVFGRLWVAPIAVIQLSRSYVQAKSIGNESLRRRCPLVSYRRIFAALSETTPAVAKEAMQAAKKSGALISYDLNYRASLWQSIGGQARAQEVNRELAPLVDVMIGNEEDFTAALGFEVEGLDETTRNWISKILLRMIERAVRNFRICRLWPRLFETP